MTLQSITGVEFELSKSSFRQQEAPNASLGIHVVMDGGKLANPVLFRVIPLTVLEAESMDIANFARPADDDVSPSIAGIHTQLHANFLLIITITSCR